MLLLLHKLHNWAKNSIKEIIAAITLEKKVELLVGNGFKMPEITSPGGPLIGTTQYKVPGAVGITFAVTRF